MKGLQEHAQSELRNPTALAKQMPRLPRPGRHHRVWHGTLHLDFDLLVIRVDGLYRGLYVGYMGIMDNKMEATITTQT